MAPVDHIEFDMETALARQLGSQPLPFPGMDKSGAAVCELYVRYFSLLNFLDCLVISFGIILELHVIKEHPARSDMFAEIKPLCASIIGRLLI